MTTSRQFPLAHGRQGQLNLQTIAEIEARSEASGVWGGLISAGAGIAGMVGYSVSEDDQQQLVTLVPAAASALGGIVAVVRRLSASKRIGG